MATKTNWYKNMTEDIAIEIVDILHEWGEDQGCEKGQTPGCGQCRFCRIEKVLNDLTVWDTL